MKYNRKVVSVLQMIQEKGRSLDSYSVIQQNIMLRLYQCKFSELHVFLAVKTVKKQGNPAIIQIYFLFNFHTLLHHFPTGNPNLKIVCRIPSIKKQPQRIDGIRHTIFEM